jgi:cytochrome c-type biogenesis protein CcmF
VVVNPLVNWIWLGFVLLAIGTAICLAPERAFALAAAEDRAGAAPDAAGGKSGATTGTLLVLLFAGALLGGARTARADGPPPMKHGEGQTVRAAPRSADENELFHKLVCMCGTCGRQLLADCDCQPAEHMRQEVAGLLDAGKTKQQVIDFYVAKYHGEDALAVSSRSWVVSVAVYGAMLLGVIGLVFAARRLTSARVASYAAAAPAARAAAPDPKDADYQARLDDELDELD